MTSVTARVAMVLYMLAAACAPLRAQEVKQGKTAPITVETDPKSVSLGIAITVRGHSVSSDAAKPVNVAIRMLKAAAAGGTLAPPAKLSAPLAKDGTYSVSYKATSEGHYRAVAMSPDGSGRDSVEFDVQSSGQTAAAAIDSLEKDLDLASDIVDADVKIIELQQPSPAKDDALKQIPELQAALADRKTAIKDYRQAWEIYGIAAKNNLQFSALGAPAFAELKEFETKSAEVTPNLKDILEQSKKVNQGCDNLMIVGEGIKFMGTLFTLAGLIPKAGALIANESFPPMAKQLLSAKALTAAGSFIMDKLPGASSKVAGLVTGALFDHYCEKFEGPISGNAGVIYLTKDGEPWWKYTLHLGGKITLAYSKSGMSKGAVALKGWIVGTGNNFTATDRTLTVLERKTTAGNLIVGQTTTPAGVPYTSLAGATAIQAIPTSFFIPVSGSYDFDSKKIKLTIEPARSDFNEKYTVATGRYVVGGVRTMGALFFVTYDIKYDKAHGIIEKATNSDLGPVEIPVTTAGKALKATRSFDEKRERPHGRGEWLLDITMCNPAC